MSKRVAFHTLGCKVNQYDTDAVWAMFKKHGYQVVDFADEADVYIINTCTVTNIGDRKSRQMIRRAHRRNQDAKIVVMGCFAQTSPEKAADIEGVNLVVGTDDRKNIVELVEGLDHRGQKSLVRQIFEVREFEELPVLEFQGKARATLKIQDGCNEFCSYCKVPFARGKSRSRRPENILAQVKGIVEQGYQEIVLTGVHLGAYGKDLKPTLELIDIVQAITEISGVSRVRISSIDPHEIDERFLKTVAENPKICRHLHIPLQSGCDQILKSMRRKYTTDEYQAIVDKARQIIPGVAITCDVIVGFPGESQEAFSDTCRFIERIGFSRLHVFPYSPRDNTPAAKMPRQVRKREKDSRSHALTEVSKKLAKRFHQQFVDSRVVVLVEQVANGMGEGFTDNYIRARFDASPEDVGKLVEVLVTSADDEGIEGNLQ